MTCIKGATYSPFDTKLSYTNFPEAKAKNITQEALDNSVATEKIANTNPIEANLNYIYI